MNQSYDQFRDMFYAFLSNLARYSFTSIRLNLLRVLENEIGRGNTPFFTLRWIVDFEQLNNLHRSE